METPAKQHQTSSPREFFERIYGDLKSSKGDSEERNSKITSLQSNDLIVTPVPALTPIPFFLPTSEAHLTVAAAGLSAFCKNYLLFTLNLYV